MDDGTPTLEAGFVIDTGGSFDTLRELRSEFTSTELQVLRDAAKIEQATKGMVNLAGASASVSSFGNAWTREGQTAAREAARIEKTGERMVAQLERQNAAFGKTRGELRGMRAEELALAADRVGNADLAQRLRTQEQGLFAQEFAATRQARFEAEAASEEKALAAQRAIVASEAEAKAVRDAANAYRMFEAVAKQKAGAHAAWEADAVAADRLRASTDPLYAATKRLNDEIAQSTRLYQAGFTAPAEYSRQQDVLADRLRLVTQQHEDANRATASLGGATKLAGHHAQNLAFQFQDLTVQMFAAAGSSAPLKMAFMAMMQQGMQIQGIMSQAQIGIGGVASAFGQMSKSILLATATNPVLLGIAVAIAAVAGTVALLNKSANDGADMKKYAESIGVSTKEMRHLDDVTVTWGDTAKAVFQVAGAGIWSGIGPAVTGVWSTMKDWLEWIGSGVKTGINYMIAGWVGGFNAIRAVWGTMPAVMGDIFVSTTNLSIEAVNGLIRKSVEGINGFIQSANGILEKAGIHLPELEAPQIKKLDNQFAGAGAKFGKTFLDELTKAAGTDYLGNAGSAIVDQAQKNARDRFRKQAEQKGYLDTRPDRHAEQLTREAAAVEAQISGLYKLADAYRVSGADALIAEARVKAETDAIKKRGDIEAFVARQVRLVLAQRAADAAKSAAAVRDQAGAQQQINALVAAGLVPASSAAEMVRDRISDLSLLAGIEAAQKVQDLKGAQELTRALNDQQAAREGLTKAEADGRFNEAMKTGNDRLAELREELRLIGATDAARARSLAELKASQDTSTTARFSAAELADYVKLQGNIAAGAVTNAQAQDAYNDALTFTADKWDLIARNASNAASGMASAFGEVGRSIGDLGTIYAGYHANRERLDAEHDAQLKKYAGNQHAMDQVNAKFALATTTAEIGALGDAASAAKGLFKERSVGYKLMSTAEKAFRAVEFAMSVKSMVQSAAETATKLFGHTAVATSAVASSGVQVGANMAVGASAAAAGVANQALGDPYTALPRMAAMAAAMAVLGFAVGGFGGGGGNKPTYSKGTGTVLGDSDAQSESITRALEHLKDIDAQTLRYSSQMAASLKNIEANIGGLASMIVRTGNMQASGTGIQTGTVGGLSTLGAMGLGPIGALAGDLISKVPIVGGLLNGIGKALFGTKTSIIGQGIQAGPQSLADIMGNGFDADYFTDVQKKKKTFGLTTSTKYSTQTTDADAELEGQFALVLRGFYDALGAAAVPLGASLDSIQGELSSFVVDLGRIDLKDKTGEEIQEQLTAVFSAAGDDMAKAAFPGLEAFQRVGEGYLETAIRVSSSVEAMGDALTMLGRSAAIGVTNTMALVDAFGDAATAQQSIGAYFQVFYTDAERTAAQTAQLSRMMEGLGLSLPGSTAAFRALVDAQDLTSDAGRQAYVTLMQLAPVFADVFGSAQDAAEATADIAKQAADAATEAAQDAADRAAAILNERYGLEGQLLQLQGNTAEIRRRESAALDVSNRALQDQIYALQDQQAAHQQATQAADQLKSAWTSIADGLLDEVKRIRGVMGASGGGFSALQAQFSAATMAARGGDQDAAKTLTGLSQSLLTAAADMAGNQADLARIQGNVAASLEQTASMVSAGTGNSSMAALLGGAAPDQPALWEKFINAQAASAQAAANDTATVSELQQLRAELAGMRDDQRRGHAVIADNTDRSAKVAENTADGDAVRVRAPDDEPLRTREVAA